ncbi:HD domain-containing phosphohydrolase [Sulfurospirillum sp. 1307]
MLSDIEKIKILGKYFKVLYVEDEEKLNESMTKYLKKFFKEVHSVRNGHDALDLFKQNNYDIIITDIIMPEMNGIEMISEIKKINKAQEIVIVSASNEVKYFVEAIKLGIDGYILKPIDYNQMNEVLYKVIYKLNEFRRNELYKLHLKELVEEKTKEALLLEEEKSETYKKTLFALVEIIEQRDTYTGGHSQRVAKYSKMIAEHMGLNKQECEDLYKAGVLHDIGKVSIPDSILLKPGFLNDVEYRLIQEHVNLGYKILSKIPLFKDMSKIVRAHHEKYDGTGYPRGLKGEEIPLCARIMVVADAFDAMTTSRVYKAKKTVREALKEIEDLKGKHFCPKVAEVALKVLKDVKIIEEATQLPHNDLEKERFSYFYRDQLTQVYNTHYLDFMLAQNYRYKKYGSINLLYLKEFYKFNKKYGWSEGDKILKEVASKLKKYFKDSFVFRIHGDDFAILSSTTLAFKPIIEEFKEKDLKIKHEIISLLDKRIESFEDLKKYIEG